MTNHPKLFLLPRALNTTSDKLFFAPWRTRNLSLAVRLEWGIDNLVTALAVALSTGRNHKQEIDLEQFFFQSCGLDGDRAGAVHGIQAV